MARFRTSEMSALQYQLSGAASMDPDAEVNNILTKSDGEEDEKEKWKRPPSSYGSMNSDSDELDEEKAEDSAAAPAVLPESPPQVETRIQMIRSESPETLYTMTTQQTKPPEAMVIDTSSLDLGDAPEDDDDDEEDEILITNSPEPPEPIEMEDSTQAEGNSQPGRLHPEQDLPHLFKSIQNILTDLSDEELLNFRMLFYHWERKMTLQRVMDGDLLDFVDGIIEVLGQERALMHTVETLKRMDKKEEAQKLEDQCRRALIGFYMKRHLIRKYQFIHEGIVEAGKQTFLNSIYVEPQITTQGYGGVDPSHELRPQPPTPVQVPSPDTFIALSDLFRLQKDDGTPVRMVVTTGPAGFGMSFSVAKFTLDWAEGCANRDIQFIIKISFSSLWYLRNKDNPTEKISLFDVIEYYHPDLADRLKILEEPNFKVLIVMDCFDCYQASLDWENAPEVSDGSKPEHPDVLIVNIIRGTLLHGAHVWILGRRAAVSQIPSKFVDVVTELQGFSDEMKDEYLTKRFSSAELAENIVRDYKRLPMLHILARHPFICWVVAKIFSRAYHNHGHETHLPRLTPFLINMLIVLMNRRKQFYYDAPEYNMRWSDEDKHLVTNIGKMALKMLERNTSVFLEEDVSEVDLQLTEVVVLSGLCTELSTASSGCRRTFSFVHFTFQEFMAAMFVFVMFHTESKNVLNSGSLPLLKIFKSKNQSKSASGLVQCALARTLSSPVGHYDMFLRYLCGLLSPACHSDLLKGYLYPHKYPNVEGLDNVQRVLEQAIQTAPEDRVGNLKECLRELTQIDMIG
ncbi:protein NLRC3 [Xenentodon cancila]